MEITDRRLYSIQMSFNRCRVGNESLTSFNTLSRYDEVISVARRKKLHILVTYLSTVSKAMMLAFLCSKVRRTAKRYGIPDVRDVPEVAAGIPTLRFQAGSHDVRCIPGAAYNKDLPP